MPRRRPCSHPHAMNFSTTTASRASSNPQDRPIPAGRAQRPVERHAAQVLDERPTGLVHRTRPRAAGTTRYKDARSSRQNGLTYPHDPAYKRVRASGLLAAWDGLDAEQEAYVTSDSRSLRLVSAIVGTRHRLRLDSAGVVGGDRHRPDQLTQEMRVVSQAGSTGLLHKTVC